MADKTYKIAYDAGQFNDHDEILGDHLAMTEHWFSVVDENANVLFTMPRERLVSCEQKFEE